jgi:hypothetical protein
MHKTRVRGKYTLLYNKLFAEPFKPIQEYIRLSEQCETLPKYYFTRKKNDDYLMTVQNS